MKSKIFHIQSLQLLLSVVFLLSLSVASLYAQTAREEIKANVNLAASNHLAYPGPKSVLTAAPKDKAPFFISHYGRHGSRYLCGDTEYSYSLGELEKANRYGKLTEYGKDVLRRVRIMSEESDKRIGELTLLGAEQHKGIAKRMFERFPEIFAGKAKVDARSTVVIRCILSMENALHQLLSMNPQLQISHDASHHDMVYMNHGKDWIEKYRLSKEAAGELQKWTDEHCSSKRLMEKIFTDQQYVSDSLESNNLYFALFKFATILQGCESRRQIDMWDLFTEDEIYNNWERNNIMWYLGYANSPQNGGLPPYVQRFLLRQIIDDADAKIKEEKPGATLRYGHETMVMPLTCLMELNDSAVQISDINKITENWHNYDIFPMAANIQIVFYRKDISDQDILIKVLLNENEATLPVKTDCAPYYHWKDVRQYYLDKLAAFDAKMSQLQAEAAAKQWGKFW